MGHARTQQVRRGRKHRGQRDERSRCQEKAAGAGAELKYAVRLVLAPEGLEPNPSRLREISAALMSDALVELMRPYIRWPPAPSELSELEAWLRLGADVWNVTVEAKDGAACAGGLARLAADLDEEEPFDLVQEIARRKFVLFSRDLRRVAAVRVIARDGIATVEATSFAYIPGAPK